MSYGRTDGDFNPSTIRTFGKKVAIKKYEQFHERIVNGIHIPENHDKAVRLCKGEILNIDADYAKEIGVNVGDIVLYDHWSAYYDTHPIVIVDYTNIIVKLDENGFCGFLPPNNKIFIVPEIRENLEEKLIIELTEATKRQIANNIGIIKFYTNENEYAEHYKNFNRIIYSGETDKIHLSSLETPEIIVVPESSILAIF